MRNRTWDELEGFDASGLARFALRRNTFGRRTGSVDRLGDGSGCGGSGAVSLRGDSVSTACGFVLAACDVSPVGWVSVVAAAGRGGTGVRR